MRQKIHVQPIMIIIKIIALIIHKKIKLTMKKISQTNLIYMENYIIFSTKYKRTTKKI